MLAASHLPFPRGALGPILRLARTPNAVRKGLALVDAGPGLEATYGVVRGMFFESQRDALVDGDALPETNHQRTLDGAIEDAFASGALDATNALGAMELTNYLSDQLLRDTDAMSMAHSLEVREPLLDHELVEAAMRIPGPEKLRGDGNKPLLGAAVPELASAVREAPKRGFDLPFAEWLRGPLREWTRERLLGSARPPFVRPAAVQAVYQEFDRGGRGVTWSRVWCLAVLADWCARHGVSA
jgi:asparagine synthase (glutamine-hydrolysing)